MALADWPPQPRRSLVAQPYATFCRTQTARVQAETHAATVSGLPTLLFMPGVYWTHLYEEQGQGL